VARLRGRSRSGVAKARGQPERKVETPCAGRTQAQACGYRRIRVLSLCALCRLGLPPRWDRGCVRCPFLCLPGHEPRRHQAALPIRDFRFPIAEGLTGFPWLRPSIVEPLLPPLRSLRLCVRTPLATGPPSEALAKEGAVALQADLERLPLRTRRSLRPAKGGQTSAPSADSVCRAEVIGAAREIRVQGWRRLKPAATGGGGWQPARPPKPWRRRERLPYRRIRNVSLCVLCVSA
jgi:hypothetical protein